MARRPFLGCRERVNFIRNGFCLTSPGYVMFEVPHEHLHSLAWLVSIGIYLVVLSRSTYHNKVVLSRGPKPKVLVLMLM
jgi:hypothetical protein